MADSAKEISQDLKRQREKTTETISNEVNAPESEQAVTRDTTPSVEHPGQKPTQPRR
jgi:hypothetical protein